MNMNLTDEFKNLLYGTHWIPDLFDADDLRRQVTDTGQSEAQVSARWRRYWNELWGVA